MIAYANRAGSTAGVAEAIGKTLGAGGVPADVRPMQDVKAIGAIGTPFAPGPRI